MRILQLTHKFPFPYHDGGAIAVRSLADGLRQSGVELDLFSINTYKHKTSISEIESFRKVSSYNSIKTVSLDTSESLLGALRHLLLGKRSYFVERFYNELVAEELLAQLNSTNYAVIILESLYMAPYIDLILEFNSSIPIILRAHNIEFELRSRQLIDEKVIRKFYLKNEIRKLKNYELSIFSKVDLVATVSEREADEIKRLNVQSEVINIPIGMPLGKEVILKVSKTGLKIGFIGSLDWKPNLHGLKWFVEEVWIHMPDDVDVECLISGAYAKNDLQFLQKNKLKYLGRVECSKEFLQSIDILIVPLFSGSGTRVKILEAMSYGVPVLSTPLGAEGIDVHHSRDILIAGTSDEWISTIKQYAQNSEGLTQIGSNGHELIKEKYDIEKLGSRLKSKIEEVIISKKEVKKG